MNITKPRTQRKNLYNLPKHKRGKQVSAPLDKTLKKEHGKTSFPIVKGDKIKILKGEFKGKTAKVHRINLKKYKIYIEGITSKKPDGKETYIPIEPSNVIITELNLNDEKRKKVLKRK